LSVSNQPVDALEKLIFVQILIDIQFTGVLNELRLGIYLLTGGKAADRADHLIPLDYHILESPLFGLNRCRQSRWSTADDDQIQSFVIGAAALENAIRFHLRNDLDTLIRGDLHQRQPRHVADDIDPFDARLKTAVDDGQDFLRRDGGEITGPRSAGRASSRRHDTSLHCIDPAVLAT